MSEQQNVQEVSKMSNDNRAIKCDAECAHFLWGHDDFREGLGENGSLSGNEVRKIVGEDTGESMIPDPVESLWKADSLNRFDEPKAPAVSPGRVLKKRASATAHRTEMLGKWRLEYDSNNRLIRAREL